MNSCYELKIEVICIITFLEEMYFATNTLEYDFDWKYCKELSDEWKYYNFKKDLCLYSGSSIFLELVIGVFGGKDRESVNFRSFR